MNRRKAAESLGEILDDDSIGEDFVMQFLTDLTKKGVDAEEISGFVDAMRGRMISLKTRADAIDVCGTGGDNKGTFNISTAAAIVLAASGVPVAKHGNRAASSRFGSADVLEALGIPVSLEPGEAARELERKNFAFLFAQKYHPALARLAGVRKKLGFPTVFNLLGPLLNPAGVRRQVIGTFNRENAEIMADTVSRLGCELVVVLVSDDGLDEASLSAPTQLVEIRGNKQTRREITAEQFGLSAAGLKELREGGNAAENARIIRDVLKPSDNLTARQRVVILNAGIGFYAAGRAETIERGVSLAADTIRSNRSALRKLEELQS